MKHARVIGLGLWIAASSFDAQAASTLPSTDTPSVQSHDDARLARRRTRRSRARTQKAEKAKPAKPQEPAASAAVENATRTGPTRIEFDERLLQGQTNKANAIYLFQRRESALRSLVKKRTHFHEEIDESLE